MKNYEVKIIGRQLGYISDGEKAHLELYIECPNECADKIVSGQEYIQISIDDLE